MIKKEIRDNVAIHGGLLNFDPVHRPFLPPAPPADGNAIDPSAGAQIVMPSSGFLQTGEEFDAQYGVRTLENGNVEITFWAPDAKTVEVAGTGGSMPRRYAMEPTGTGYWKTTLTDVGPGFHFNVFFVDGVMTFNPTMPFGFGYSYVLNYFEVPDPNEDFYLVKDVPHGSVRMELMKSDITGRWRNLWVYTPAGYDTSDKRYPVMHILHGGGENEIGWFWQGKLNNIADNLIAEGGCEEMIIVASSFAAPREIADGRFVEESFPEVMTKEIVPFIDKTFRTIADRNHRAMAGLSAGGKMSRQIAHGYPEVFANLGQFSTGAGFEVKGVTKTPCVGGPPAPSGAADPYEDKFAALFSTPEEYNAKMDITFITCGTDDPRHKYTEPQVAELKDAGYNVSYTSYPGYHEWDVWRYSARDFMKVLFKK